MPGYLHHPLGDSSPQFSPPNGSLYPRWTDLADLTPWQVATCVAIPDHKFAKTLYYGHNPQSLYLRVDFRCPIAQIDPDELHVWWYYPGVPHAHAPAAIASLPDLVPLNYYFHHHCLVNLPSQQAHHEIAINPVTWQRSQQRPKVIQQEQTVVVSLPVELLAQPRNPTLHLLVMLAEQGEFHSQLSGDRLLEWHCG